MRLHKPTAPALAPALLFASELASPPPLKPLDPLPQFDGSPRIALDHFRWGDDGSFSSVFGGLAVTDADLAFVDSKVLARQGPLGVAAAYFNQFVGGHMVPVAFGNFVADGAASDVGLEPGVMMESIDRNLTIGDERWLQQSFTASWMGNNFYNEYHTSNFDAQLEYVHGNNAITGALYAHSVGQFGDLTKDAIGLWNALSTVIPTMGSIDNALVYKGENHSETESYTSVEFDAASGPMTYVAATSWQVNGDVILEMFQFFAAQ